MKKKTKKKTRKSVEIILYAMTVASLALFAMRCIIDYLSWEQNAITKTSQVSSFVAYKQGGTRITNPAKLVLAKLIVVFSTNGNRQTLQVDNAVGDQVKVTQHIVENKRRLAKMQLTSYYDRQKGTGNLELNHKDLHVTIYVQSTKVK